jgi:hypothetical protein
MQRAPEVVAPLVSDLIELSRGIVITIRQIRVRGSELLDRANCFKSSLADALDLGVLSVDLLLH